MQISKQRWLGSWLIVLGLAVACGCSGDSIDPEYKPVTGTVTLDGQPLPDAQIAFVPPGTGSSGSGFTDENGQYQLYYAARRAGAKLGENQVFITKSKPPTGKQGEFVQMSEAEMELLPARYNRKTELTATVEDKRNEIDFQLQSK